MRGGVRRAVRDRMAMGLVAATAVLAVAPARAQSQADRWGAAIAEQKDAIATNRTAQARCRPAGDPQCAALAERGRLMEQNLGRLERQHARMTGAPPPSSARVTSSGRPDASATRGRGVGEPPPGVTIRYATPAPQRGFFSMLFGGGGTTEAAPSSVRIDGEPLDAALDGEAGAPGEGEWGPGSGNYRTLCVRTCDGYFFPVSFNASQARLATDAKVCRALCPDAETRLFYHGAGQEAEDAIAADDGSPLTRMPNAFLYRSTRVAGCGCGTPDPRTLPVQAGGLDGLAVATASDPARVPLPRVRPTPGQDPATQAIELSGLPADPVAPQTPIPAAGADRIAAAAPATPRRVRIVGPKWLSDRSAEAGASSPDRGPVP